MMYLMFITEAEAKAYSHAEAVKHGRGKTTDTIQYWWAIRQCADGRWTVQCPDGTEEPELLEVTNEDN